MSNPSDRVLGTPPTNTSANNPSGSPEESPDSPYLPTDVSPEEVFQAIGRLRKEARDEINRLIGFLDKTDDYVSRELEDDGDQGDASYREGLQRMSEHPMEDDEDAGDDEPSLGSSGHYHGGPISYSFHPISDGHELILDCEGDEHDGAEDDQEGDDSPDNEPSLGWTIDGAVGNRDDREEGGHAIRTSDAHRDRPGAGHRGSEPSGVSAGPDTRTARPDGGAKG